MNGYYRGFHLKSVNSMTRSVLLVALLSLFTLTAKADTPEPPVRVSPHGADAGDCQDTAAPCRSLSYALQQVGKNGQIRVASGSYELTRMSDIAYLVSAAIDVRTDPSNSAATTLLGVPHAFAEKLESKGFTVIADTKGFNRKAVETHLSMNNSAVATACTGGLAGAFPCSNVDLLAHVADRTASASGADIWGFMDLNTNREYAIVGYSTGTAVFDVTDAENPREVGFVSGQRTTWRDIKVYQFWNGNTQRFNAYAYITADNASDGLFILDLNDLPHSISRVSYASDFAAAHNVYLVDAEFSTGLSISGDSPTLILAGANISDGRFRAYSLANPEAPSFITAPSTPPDQPGGNRLYMHDAASMIVTDSRKDSQCVNAGGSTHCDVLFDFNESTVDIWDVTNPANPSRLSQLPYSNARYTHSGWWSEDQQFLFIQDELDERDRGLSTTLRVYSIADLTAPTLAGSWIGPTTAIDHNGFVRGNRYYMSNYARGLSILDISNPGSPALVGRFDTFPDGDSVGFPGNWGAYPYLPSGNIALSDIDRGFFMVADNTLNATGGSLSFTADAFGSDESQALVASVQRLGGSAGAVGVRWELVHANSAANDVTVSSGALSWSDGDSADKQISIPLNNDGSAEGLERMLLRLIAPSSNATLSGPNIASAYIGDPGDTPVVQFSETGLSVSERGFGTAVVVVHRSSSAAGTLSVDYAISGGDAGNGSDYVGPASGTITWPDGDANPRWIEYTITDDGSGEANEFFEVSLSNAAGGSIGGRSSLRVDILDGTGVNSAPNSVAGNNQTVSSGASVTLNGSASNDPDGDSLTYAWTQTMGTTVTLSGASSASASFTAPSVTSDDLLRFDLTVTDPGGQTDTSTASVTVSANAGGGNAGGGGGGGTLHLLAVFALLLLSARAAVTRKDAS
ncbi:MAG: choice-of-anchor B family protein [Gammaproteobacteria bacterium]|nr:choice-of-anchor B family protein [Gammaproteobacteria bacterium]